MMLVHVVGARPNFPKLAPVWRAARARGLQQFVVHTGQHYDDAMSAAMLRDVEAPEPDVNLGVGSASHALQTGRIMEGLESLLATLRPMWIITYGDVNSTLAAALVAAKGGLRQAHVEAGVRSGDRSMPEEINRLVADRLADLCLAPSRDAADTLAREGVADERIAMVGNVMVDALVQALPRAVSTGATQRYGASGAHVLVTLHRPANVDDPTRLRAIIAALDIVAETHPVVFPVHPRTQACLESAGITSTRLTFLPPLRYLEVVDLQRTAFAVVTDSGGMQVESTALGVPCVTVRTSTEWGETIHHGTNVLVPEPQHVAAAVESGPLRRRAGPPTSWDGHAAERIVDALMAKSGGRLR